MKQKRSALDRTAAERNYVAEATRRRRRILRSRILFYSREGSGPMSRGVDFGH